MPWALETVMVMTMQEVDFKFKLPWSWWLEVSQRSSRIAGSIMPCGQYSFIA